MKRSIFAIICSLSVAVMVSVFAMPANAGCGNCDFPMAKLYGKWESGNTELILQQRSRNGGTVVVDVAVLDSRNGAIIARGHGVGNVDNTDLRVQLEYRNGARRIFMLSIGDDSGQLHINLGSLPKTGNCKGDLDCLDFTQLIAGQHLNEDDIFSSNPDPVNESETF